MSKLKAVLFDMDGTVLDTELIHLRAWEKALADFGVFNVTDILYRCIGLADVLMKDLFKKEISDTLDFEVVYAKARDYSRVTKSQGIPIKKGFIELNDYLQENGIKSAIVTSTVHESAVHDLTNSGIIDRFDLVSGFGDYEDCKPASAPYLTAAERLGLTPSECLAVEDSVNGVLSAYNAGIRCIYIRDIIDNEASVKDIIFKKADNLFELINIIGGL